MQHGLVDSGPWICVIILPIIKPVVMTMQKICQEAQNRLRTQKPIFSGKIIIIIAQ
jgi:hypothetical protein